MDCSVFVSSDDFPDLVNGGPLLSILYIDKGRHRADVVHHGHFHTLVHVDLEKDNIIHWLGLLLELECNLLARLTFCQPASAASASHQSQSLDKPFYTFYGLKEDQSS